MQNYYQFHPKLVLRTPKLPFEPQNITEEKIKQIVNEKWFQEAIFLASPDLFRMAMDWINGVTFEPRKQEKLLASLTKYYSRMMSRCTPYGLFAACSVVEWGNENKIIVDEQNLYRSTRLDMHFSCALAQNLVKNQIIRQNLLYYPNSSIYQIGDEVRYVDYQYVNGKRSHQISAVNDSEYLQKILTLCRQGANYHSLIEILIDDEISHEESEVFINDLIDLQVLVNELEPAITGGNFTNQVVKVLEKNNHNESLNLSDRIKKIEDSLKQLDHNKTNQVVNYQSIIEDLKGFEVDFEENKLFQTDLFLKHSEANLSTDLQSTIFDGIAILNRLAPVHERENLKRFIKRFVDRYETQEVPLLEALDTETGIGYLENQGMIINPLIQDIQLPQNQADRTILWVNSEKWFLGKLQKSNEERCFEIEITDKDLTNFPEADYSDLPPSFSVMFRVVDGEKVYLESCGGSSAVNLLGRFAEGNEEILEISKSITQAEQSYNQDIIFAEIIHLPESRTGNILLHPVFREYEVPFLGKSSLSENQQVDLRDLYISIKKSQIVLRSKRLNKMIVPRLSNAHNYSFNALPIYQFLCDLQHQGKRTGLHFTWGSFANEFEFLPRVTYKNVILEPATWNISIPDSKFENWNFNNLLTNQHLSSPLFVLVDSDNELLVDFSNPLSIASLKDAVKNRSQFQLKEFLYQQNSFISCHSDNKGFSNQFIAALIKQDAAYKPNNELIRNHKIQRSFLIGSEWLYFKLYGGVKNADRVLTEYIKPLIDNLIEMNLIDYWFFIRYSDPSNHLRVRVHLPDTSKVGEVILQFHQNIQRAVEVKLLSKIQTDTYERELERYDFENIEFAEKLFFHNSEAIIHFLELTEGDERENLRWLWGIKATDELLNIFRFELSQKLQLLQSLKEGFGREFGLDISLKKQLDKKYRDNRTLIVSSLSDETDFFDIKTFTTKEVLSIVDLILSKKTQHNLSDLVASFIHMQLNRLFVTDQRLCEFLIYDFLFRHYTSCYARNNKN
jgi:lantibiotic biosynthesis protein